MLRDMFSFRDINTAQLVRKFTALSDSGIGIISIQATGGRDNGPCMRITANYSALKTYDIQAKWIFGHRRKYTAVPVNLEFFSLKNSGTNNIRYVINADGTISVYSGADEPVTDATLLATSTRTLSMGVEYYIETETLFDTSGYCKVNVNGSNTGWINYSGNTGSANVNEIGINGAMPNGGYSYISDVYIADGQEGDVTAMLGPRRCDAYFFSSDGHYTDWTQSTGATLRGCVDDNPANDDTDYITGGYNDKFTLKTLSMGFTPISIAGVKLTGTMKIEAAGTSLVKRLIRKATTDYESDELPPVDLDYNGVCDILEQDPATSAAFTKTDLESNLEFGFHKTL